MDLKIPTPYRLLCSSQRPVALATPYVYGRFALNFRPISHYDAARGEFTATSAIRSAFGAARWSKVSTAFGPMHCTDG